MQKNLNFYVFIGLLLFMYSFPAFSGCRKFLSIHSEYIALIDIAAENKARREKLMQDAGPKKEVEIKAYLLEAIKYEEEKANIYIAMLDKILRRDDPGAYIKTATEIKRRLIKSLKNYENFYFSLAEFPDFQAKPIDAPMSDLVAQFVEN